MNIKMYTDKNYRDNVLMQTRASNDICYADSYSAEEVKRNSKGLSLTPLFHTSPPQIPYSQLTETAYAERLVDELNLEAQQ